MTYILTLTKSNAADNNAPKVCSPLHGTALTYTTLHVLSVAMARFLQLHIPVAKSRTCAQSTNALDGQHAYCSWFCLCHPLKEVPSLLSD